MKRKITGLLGIIMAVTVSMCTPKIELPDEADLNRGALLWNRALDSFKVQFPSQTAEIYRAKDYKSLQDDKIVFYSDGTGVRTQGDSLFFAAPQIKSIQFNWSMAQEQTNILTMWGDGRFDPTKPFNEVGLSVDFRHNVLKLFVVPITPDQPFLVYWYHQIPQ